MNEPTSGRAPMNEPTSGRAPMNEPTSGRETLVGRKPAGSKIIEGIKQAIAGDFASVTVDGQTWVRSTPLPAGADVVERAKLALLELHKFLPAASIEQTVHELSIRGLLRQPEAAPEGCPNCHANLDGGPIPEKIRHNYSPPYRWTRKIGISDGDGVHTWRCPDCNHTWDASAPAPASGQEGCRCQRCGHFYKVDLLIADDLWKQIATERLLCGKCVIDAIERLKEFGAFRLSPADAQNELVKALEQIQAVCADNSKAERPDLALKFVREVAETALSATGGAK
jgi:hypothetical protein